MKRTSYEVCSRDGAVVLLKGLRRVSTARAAWRKMEAERGKRLKLRRVTVEDVPRWGG